jgi:hypothetical protein
MAGRLGRLLKPMRPVFRTEVEQVVAPVYARRDELEAIVAELRTAVAEIGRVLDDHLDATNDVNAVFGRQLADVSQGIDSLQAAVDALRSDAGP